jgi:nitroreductase
LASENLTIQATSMGLFIHMMAGFHPDKVCKLLKIPEGYEPVAAIALGYPGNPQTLPERLRERELAPRRRKQLQEFVFTGQWGKASSWITDQKPI